MKRERNLLKQFFGRIAAALVLTMLLWGGAIYYYQLSQLPARIEQSLGTTTESLALQLRGIDSEATFLSRARAMSERYHLLMLEYYGPDHTLRFSYVAPGTDEELQNQHRRWHELIKQLYHESEYFVTRDDTRHYLHFSMTIPDDGGRYAEATITVPKRQVESVRRSALMVLFVTVGTILVTVAALFPLVYVAYRTLKRQQNALLASNLQMINALGNAIAKRDSDTDSHNHRVVYYAVKLAQRLQMDDEEIRGLIKGAFLHDIGKIGIRDDILLKPGPLDREMFETMKRHTVMGEEIVARVSWLEDARPVIRHHHECYDGRGYPDGLSGDQIPRNAKIFALVDVFDALTSKRPYKGAFAFEEAVKIIRSDIGRRFDPLLAEAFLEIAQDLFEAVHDKGVEEIRLLLIENIKHYFELPEEFFEREDNYGR